MNRLKRRGLIAAVLALVAVPALAQHSDSYNFLKAVRSRDTATAMALVADPRSTALNARGSDGDGALHILIRSRSQTDLTWITYFLSRGARPDLQNRDGDTPLMLAAQNGWTEAVEALIARGANVNLSNGRGETPLIRAVQQRDIAMVRVLVANGADPSHMDSIAGYSAIDYARRDNRAAAILRVLEAPRPAPARPATRPATPSR